MSAVVSVRRSIARQVAARNACSAAFFAAEAPRLAAICRAMAGRFQRGGRLLAFGSGAAISDAQHIAVEFVHPVLVGKRALPAVDLSATHAQSLPVIVRPDDIVVAFSSPGGDCRIDATLGVARARGALTLAFPGTGADYAAPVASTDPFIHQELVEIAYHTLWETVHVYLERTALRSDAGPASFLYPFLGDDASDGDIVAEVAASICAKAVCVERLREQIAREQADAIAAAVESIRARVARGGTMLCFGNGGSATDAADVAHDLTVSPKGYAPVPALSLAADAATLSAIANDVGVDSLFVRQIMAHGRPDDVVFAISTSGGSSNVIAALAEARTRGLLTVALVGYDGGEILRRGLADHVMVVASDQVPRIQEAQASVYHVMIDLLAAPGLTDA